MKHTFLFLAFFNLMVISYSQYFQGSKEYFLKKSANQKTAGWFMIAGGATITLIGIASFDNTVDPADFSEIAINVLPAFLTAVGIGTAIGSIAFFRNSKKYARRAAALSFDNQRVLFPQQNNTAFKLQRAITLKMEL